MDNDDTTLFHLRELKLNLVSTMSTDNLEIL